LALSFLIDYGTSQIKGPQLDIRARGIAGRLRTSVNQQNTGTIATSVAFLLATVLIPLVYLLYSRMNRERAHLARLESQVEISPSSVTQHLRGHQAGIIAYVLSKNGFVAEANDVLNRAKDSVAFWIEADRLTAIALSSRDNDMLLRSAMALDDALKYMEGNLMKSTVSIVRLDQAKLYLALADSKLADRCYQEALAADNEIVELRTRLDAELALIGNVPTPLPNPP
jgi:hypothetical protein